MIRSSKHGTTDDDDAMAVGQGALYVLSSSSRAACCDRSRGKKIPNCAKRAAPNTLAMMDAPSRFGSSARRAVSVKFMKLTVVVAIHCCLLVGCQCHHVIFCSVVYWMFFFVVERKGRGIQGSMCLKKYVRSESRSLGKYVFARWRFRFRTGVVVVGMVLDDDSVLGEWMIFAYIRRLE